MSNIEAVFHNIIVRSSLLTVFLLVKMNLTLLGVSCTDIRRVVCRVVPEPRKGNGLVARVYPFGTAEKDLL